MQIFICPLRPLRVASIPVACFSVRPASAFLESLKAPGIKGPREFLAPCTPPTYNKKPSVKKLQGSKRQFLNFLARAQGGAGGPTAQEKTEGDRILLFHCLSSPQVFFFGANIYQNAGTIFCSVLLLSLAYAICKFPVKLTSIAFSNLRNWCPMSTHFAVFRIPFQSTNARTRKCVKKLVRGSQTPPKS